MRAYSHGSKIAVEAAKPVIMQNCLVCEARCAYNQYGKVSSLIIGVGAAVDDTVYESDVLVKFHIKPDLLGTLNKNLRTQHLVELRLNRKTNSILLCR